MAILHRESILFCGLSSKPLFMYYTFFGLLTRPLVQRHIFFFLAKIFSFIKRDFQILGCIFVTELCIARWMPIAYSWSTVICLLIDIPWERWVQLWDLNPLDLFHSNVVCFKTRNQFLGQTSMLCRLDKAIINEANLEKHYSFQPFETNLSNQTVS